MIVNNINKEVLELLQNARPSNWTYKQYLAWLFEQYMRKLRDNQNEIEEYCIDPEPFEVVIKKVEDACDKLLAIYDLYMQGRVGKAADDMDSEFLIEEAMSIYAVELPSNEPLYRARTIESSQGSYDVKEMFHVPFEKRGKISNNRYSIAGFPCLYFGTSILACWEEMHKPNIDSLCVSRVNKEEAKHMTVIDLSWKEDVDSIIPEDEKQKYDKYYEILTWIERLPLIIACSIRAYDPAAPFKEEYVIPQVLLLACIENERIDGVAYTSTRRDEQISSDMGLHKNYAFPVKEVTDKGYCTELARKFRLTRGVSFMEAEIKNVFQGRGTPTIDVKGETLCIDNWDDGKTEYECTKFGQMEEYLGQQQFYTLHKSMGVWEVCPVEGSCAG